MKLRHPILMALLMLAFFVGSYDSSSGGQDRTDPLIVDVAVLPPMVMKSNNGQFFGFDIDLWEAVARELNLGYRYREVPLKDIFGDLRSGKADAGLPGLSITSDREEHIDFSTPYFDSGLRIMVRKGRDLGVTDAVKSVLTKDNLRLIILFVISVAILGLVFWLVEKRPDR